MSRLLDRLWYGTPPAWMGILKIPLALAAGCYAAGQKIDRQLKLNRQKALPRPVVSIGNVTVGGTGKTPMTIQLAEWLLDWGFHPCVLSRGYGAESKAARQVDKDSWDWRQFGDEPLLIAKTLPGAWVYAGASRYEAGILALQEHPDIDVFLLDDGFQHRQLARDLDLVLVDGDRGFGNKHLLPLGPLREPLSALGRADRVGAIFRGSSGSEPPESFPQADFQATLQPLGFRLIGESSHKSPFRNFDTTTQENLLPGPVHLFSAIGSPQGFRDTVSGLGIEIEGETIFPDHHPFTEQDISRVLDECRKRKVVPLTTAKDEIRLVKYKSLWTQGPVPIIMEVGLKFGDGEYNLTNALKKILQGGRRDP